MVELEAAASERNMERNHDFMIMKSENLDPKRKNRGRAKGYMKGEVFFLDSHTFSTT